MYTPPMVMVMGSWYRQYTLYKYFYTMELLIHVHIKATGEADNGSSISVRFMFSHDITRVIIDLSHIRAQGL